jgi:hypothetical protein
MKQKAKRIQRKKELIPTRTTPHQTPDNGEGSKEHGINFQLKTWPLCQKDKDTN